MQMSLPFCEGWNYQLSLLKANTLCGNRSFWYKLKHWNCQKNSVISSMTSIEWAWIRKTFWVNIPPSLRHVCETIYNSTKWNCIETTSCQLSLRRFNRYPPWPCLLVTVSTSCRNPEISPLCSGFFEFLALVFDKWWNTKKSLGFFLLTFSTTTNNDANNYIYISSNWFWLRLRDTNIADSNRCQAAGHIGENQERWFTVTLQCVSIQVSTGFPGYEATCSQFRRCDTYK